MKCIVTGGAGFIGSHIVDELIQLGNEVIVIDNETSDAHEKPYYNSAAKYFKYDICDTELIRPLFEGVDTVFHLAAESRIQPCIKNPCLATMTNTFGTASVLQCAREMSVRRVVYSSTSAAYGLNTSSPNMEIHSEDCLNPYSVSKVAGEKLCKMYSDLYGLETIVFRYFNVYGERQPTRGQYAPVIGIFQRQLKEQKPLTLVPDGQQRRDFVHVSDVVNANILASTVSLQHTDFVKYGDIFNIGSGENYSVQQIADMISFNQVFVEPREGEAKTTLACIHRAETYLGWKPKVNLKDWLLK